MPIARYHCLHRCSAEKSKNRFSGADDICRRAGLLSIFGAIVLGASLLWLISLVYGAAFTQAIKTALILLPGIVLTGSAEILNQDLRGQGHPMAGMFARIAG